MTDQAKPDELPETSDIPRWRQVLRIGTEVVLILVLLGLIGAFLAPVIKGPSSTTVKPPDAGSTKPTTAASRLAATQGR